jgi:hypothetical protein
MINKWFFLIAGALLLAGAAGCNSSPQASGQAEMELFPLDFTPIAEVESLVDSVQIIALEETDSSLLGEIEKILIDGQSRFIILAQNELFLFAADGRFLHRIGRQGRGPEEYVSIKDVCLTHSGAELLIYDGRQTVLKYAVESGQYRQTITLQGADNFFGEAIAPSADGGFYLVTTDSENYSDVEQAFDCLYEFDAQGVLIDRSLPRTDYVIAMNLVTQSYPNKYILRPLDADNVCYELGTEPAPKPVYRLNFETQGVPPRYVFDANGELDLQKYMFSDYFKMPIYIHENDQAFFFTAAGPEASSHDFIYLKESGKGVRLSSEIPEMRPFIFRAVDRDFFYGVVYPGLLLEEDVNQMGAFNRLIYNAFSGTEPAVDQPYLVGLKIK